MSEAATSVDDAVAVPTDCKKVGPGATGPTLEKGIIIMPTVQITDSAGISGSDVLDCSAEAASIFPPMSSRSHVAVIGDAS